MEHLCAQKVAEGITLGREDPSLHSWGCSAIMECWLEAGLGHSTPVIIGQWKLTSPL